jgi:hypothetical protein
MTDLAALGFKIETAGLREGVREMDKLTAASKRTETAASGVSAAMSKTSTGTTAAARAQQRYIQQIDRVNKYIDQNNRAAALGAHHMTNLGFQINDVATMLAMGQDPFRIMASQAGQFYQVLSQGEGGVKGSLSYLKDVLVGMVTPARLATAGLLGIGAAAATVAYQWASAQRDIEIALMGVGSAAGLTAGQINQIAAEAAAAGVTSVGEARALAVQFAETGKIGAEMTESLLSVSRNVALIFGEDLEQSGERLAKAFMNPAKGVDDLNTRLGAFSDRTRQTIISLTNQGNILEAQRLLFDGLSQSTRNAEERLSSFGKAWNYVKDKASEYFEFVGRRTALFWGYADIYTQYIEAQDQLAEKLRANESAIFDFQKTLNQPGIDRLIEKIAELERELAKAADEGYRTRINLESVSAGNFIRELEPDVRALSKILDDIKRAQNIRGMPGVMESLDEIEQRGLARGEQSLKLRYDYFLTAFEIAKQEHDIQLRTIGAMTVAQRAQIAHEQTLNRLRRGGDLEASEKARMAAELVYSEAAQQTLRAHRDRIAANDDIIARAQTELGLVGQNRFEQQRVQAILEARLQLENEALNLYGDRAAYDGRRLAALTEQIEKQAVLNKLIAGENLAWDLRFDREQMGRSSREQAVYAQMRAAGLLTNGEIGSDPYSQATASMIRYTEVMRIAQDAQKDFATGLVNDLRDGVSATEALANAMNRLADKFLDMAMDDAFSRFFAPFSSAIASGATGWSPAPMTGWGASVFPAYHSGGVVGQGSPMTRYVHPAVFDGAPRYHNGGVAGLRSNEVPAILERGETVIPKGGAGGGSGPIFNFNTTVDAAGADPQAVARLERALSEDRSRRRRDVIEIMRDARQRGYA